MNTHLTQAIIKTIAFFDIFDYPLTKEEVERWLWQFRASSLELSAALQSLCNTKSIMYDGGLFALPGREAVFSSRDITLPVMEEKLEIAKRAAKKLRFIPFLEAVFVCNTVAASAAKKTSDIDVFIVVKEGRLWLTRFLTTVMLSLFRLRRTKRCIANRICLSFYVTRNALNLSSIQMGEPDIYLLYWLDQLIPIYDPSDVRSVIMHENEWAKTYLPQAYEPYIMNRRFRVEDTRLSVTVKHFGERVWLGSYGNILESQAKQLQTMKMKQNITSLQNQNDSRVIVSDTMLKFHENDRRTWFREEWEKRCRLYLSV